MHEVYEAIFNAYMDAESAGMKKMIVHLHEDQKGVHDNITMIVKELVKPHKKTGKGVSHGL
jgi:pyridoxine 5'-phosphate synthase PdxJ